MKELTSFGKSIKVALINKGKTQAWLIGKVKENTGLFFDSSYMYKILTGTQKNPKIINAIREILELEEKGD